jgi:hypothetical protein
MELKNSLRIMYINSLLSIFMFFYYHCTFELLYVFLLLMQLATAVFTYFKCEALEICCLSEQNLYSKRRALYKDLAVINSVAFIEITFSVYLYTNYISRS